MKRCMFQIFQSPSDMAGGNNYFKKVQPNRSTGRRGISIYADGSIVALIRLGERRNPFRLSRQQLELGRAL